ncbi:MAG: ABC transporter ATP-binding protein [Candidatus Heimdallarchaeota archaeon]|nr:MAG: ABC transporter ATP-binding protein [Candidatus Heimdallarchaeota archaeon]
MISDSSQTKEEMLAEKILWSQLWEWLKPDKFLLILLIGIMAINVGIAVFGPLLLQATIDLLENTSPLSDIQRTVLLLTGIYALSLVLKVFTYMIQGLFVAEINPRFIHRVRRDAYGKIIRNQVRFFDHFEVGRIVSRVTNDSNELLDSGRRFAEAFSQLIIFIVVFIIMLYFSPILTVAATFIAPFLFISILLLRKIQRKIADRWRRNISGVNARFGEVMGSIAISKSFGREEENFKEFNELNEKTYQAAKKRGMAIFAIPPMDDFLRTFGLIILLYVAAIQVVNAGESVAIVYLFILLHTYLYEPIGIIAWNYNRFQSSFAALERIIKIMATEDTSEDVGGELSAESINGDISFQQLNFGYLENIPVLEDISFNIEAGETIAIVGHTGAGKSTLFSLLMRFYEYTKGEILIDGHSIRDYNLQSLRNSIGYVAQDVLLFNGSIKDNMKIAKPNATEEEIWTAIDTVQAREFIETLPNGLDTLIIEGGKNISQGQQQMLSLARALLSDPRILLLDEFTASLDMYTESKIQEAIRTLLQNRTSIVIAHRLTTILRADKIFVLESGKLIEHGTHEDLITKKGKYAEIYTKYFAFQFTGLTPLLTAVVD